MGVEAEREGDVPGSVYAAASTEKKARGMHSIAPFLSATNAWDSGPNHTYRGSPPRPALFIRGASYFVPGN